MQWPPQGARHDGQPFPKNLPLQVANVQPLDISLSPSALDLVVSIPTHGNSFISCDHLKQLRGSPVLGLDHLLSNDIIEHFEPISSESYGVVFAGWIPEKLNTPKARLRHVSDAVSANIEAPRPSVSFRPIGDLLRLCAKLCQHETSSDYLFIQLDLKTSFYQVELPQEVRQAFVFAHIDPQRGTRYFRYKRLPMGYSLAVDILQNIIEAFAKLSLREAHVAPLCTDLYVDNVLFVVHRSDAPLLIRAIEAISKQFNITLGELNCGRSVSHRGCSLDMDSKSYSLSNSFQEKIMARLPNPHMVLISRLALESLHGSLQYAEQVIRPAFVRDQYHQVQALAHSRKSFVCLAPALREEILRSRTWLFSRVSFAKWLPFTPSSLAFTDASGVAIASVVYEASSTTTWHTLLSQVRPQGTGTLMSPKHHLNISQLELRAVIETILLYSKSPPRIYSDNISAVCAMRNRFSKRIAMMNELRRLTPPHFSYEVSYINTRYNPADAPSRCSLASRCARPPPLLTLLQFPLAFVARNTMGCRKAEALGRAHHY